MLTPSSKTALGFNSLGTQFLHMNLCLTAPVFPQGLHKQLLMSDIQHITLCSCVVLELFGG